MAQHNVALPKCETPDCTAQAPRGRFCRTHYQKQNKRRCSLAACDQAHAAQGYCKSHYRRFKRYGDPLGWKPQQTAACEVPGCEGKPWARNMCSAHYQRWRKYGDAAADKPIIEQGEARRPIVGPPRERRFCVIDGCDTAVHGHGWCFKHYQRWRAHGDPQWEPARHTECAVDRCGKQPRSVTAALCEAHYMRLRRNGTLEAGQCSVCQEPLPPDSMINRLFCGSCYLDRRRVRARDQEHRRRAAMLSGESERINSPEIYERDGWRCGLCRRRVDPTLRWPHRMSPSLDHIVPLAKGGHHVRTNVHLAHLTCNLSKRDRGGGEQLMLIG